MLLALMTTMTQPVSILSVFGEVAIRIVLGEESFHSTTSMCGALADRFWHLSLSTTLYRAPLGAWLGTCSVVTTLKILRRQCFVSIDGIIRQYLAYQDVS